MDNRRNGKFFVLIQPGSSRVNISIWLRQLDSYKTLGEAKWKLAKDAVCCFKTNTASRTLQNNGRTATYLPSHKLSKYIKQDLLGTARNRD